MTSVEGDGPGERGRTRWRPLVVGVIALVSLALVLRGLDPAAALAAVATLDLRGIPIAATAYGVGLLARAARFWVLLSRRVGYGRVLGAVGAGRLATAALPPMILRAHRAEHWSQFRHSSCPFLAVVGRSPAVRETVIARLILGHRIA